MSEEHHYLLAIRKDSSLLISTAQCVVLLFLREHDQALPRKISSFWRVTKILYMVQSSAIVCC